MTDFEALARRIEPGSRLLRTWELEGGVSAQVTALELERRDGRIEKLIVRRHPRISVDQFRLLQLLSAAGVPVPAPRFFDEQAACLVVDCVEGERPRVDEPGLAGGLAAALAAIHGLDPRELAFLPGRRLPDAAERNRPVLLHGDFWPGNTLWRDGRLVAVIDWEDAAVGDPLADVANARLELAWWKPASSSGFDAMNEFTRAYRSLMPDVDFTDLPHWDLWADRRLAGHIADWGLEEPTVEAMRAAHELFVAQALKALAAR